MPYSKILFPVFAHFSYHKQSMAWKARETTLSCNNFPFVSLNSRSFKPVCVEYSLELMMRPRTFLQKSSQVWNARSGLSLCITKNFKYSSLPFSMFCLKQNWGGKKGQVCMLCKPFCLAKLIILNESN